MPKALTRKELQQLMGLFGALPNREALERREQQRRSEPRPHDNSGGRVRLHGDGNGHGQKRRPNLTHSDAEGLGQDLQLEPTRRKRSGNDRPSSFGLLGAAPRRVAR